MLQGLFKVDVMLNPGRVRMLAICLALAAPSGRAAATHLYVFRDGYAGTGEDPAYRAISLALTSGLDVPAVQGAPATLGGQAARHLLIRWDLSGADGLPAGIEIRRVTILLTLAGGASPGTVRFYALSGANDAWFENLGAVTGNCQDAGAGLRWQTADGADTTLGAAAGVRLGTADWTDGVCALTLDAAHAEDAATLAVVQGWLTDPQTNLGVKINSESSPAFEAYGSGAGAAFRPTLIVETAPEPAALAVLTVGAAMLLWRRKRAPTRMPPGP